jgi:hypothetical protein
MLASPARKRCRPMAGPFCPGCLALRAAKKKGRGRQNVGERRCGRHQTNAHGDDDRSTRVEIGKPSRQTCERRHGGLRTLGMSRDSRCRFGAPLTARCRFQHLPLGTAATSRCALSVLWSHPTRRVYVLSFGAAASNKHSCAFEGGTGPRDRCVVVVDTPFSRKAARKHLAAPDTDHDFSKVGAPIVS